MLQPAPLSWLIRFDTGQRCSTSSVAAGSSSRPGSAALHFFKSRSGSLAMFAAMRRASSRRRLDVVGASMPCMTTARQSGLWALRVYKPQAAHRAHCLRGVRGMAEPEVEVAWRAEFKRTGEAQLRATG